MKRSLLILLALAPVVGLSQLQKQSPRVQAIILHAWNRMTTQNDIWFDGGDFPRAVSLLKYLHEMDPTDYEATDNLGWMMENIEQYGPALAEYVRYRKENPQDPDAPMMEAEFFFKRKLYARVPGLLDPQTKLAQKPHANTFRMLAHAYERLNLLSDSKRVWDIYIQMKPEDLAAKNNLRRVEKKLKDSKAG